MKTNQVNRPSSPPAEFNLRDFFHKAWEHKFWYILSLAVFGAIALLYIKWAPPRYEVDASILVDAKGTGRTFGESQFVDGGVHLIETEKNLYNEMNILKSVNLVRQTVEDLHFQVSYFAKDRFRTREHYKDYPVTVRVQPTGRQLVNTPLQIEILSEETYRIIVDEKEHYILERTTQGNVIPIKQNILLLSEHRFGEIAQTDYYNVIIERNPNSLHDETFEEKELFIVVHPWDDLVRSYQQRTEVNQVDLQASILHLSIKGEVLQKEIDFLNQLNKNYIESKLEERNEIASNKIRFIENQLASITDSLNRAERSLELFRKNSSTVDLTQTGANALSKYEELQSSQAQAQMNLNYYNSLLDYIKDSSGINQIVAPSVVGIDDVLLNENLLELKRLNSDLARAQFLGGPKSYDGQVIEKQIELTTQNLQENVRNLVASTQLSIRNYANRIAALETTISSLPTQEKKLISYERSTKLYENLYNYLSQELAKTGIALAEELPDITVLNEARMVGTGPVAPQKKMIMLLAMMLGLVVPSIFVSMRSLPDQTISGHEMIEAHSSVPLLAQIASDPTIKKKDSITAEHWQTKESIRDLHANVKFFLPNYWKKVIAVTSSVPGEGKTFTAANLAMTMASAGNKVLLIDADFRNPSLSRHLGVNPNSNFSTYLNGWTDHSEDIIRTHHRYRKLDYITTSAASINPHRYLQNPKFEFLIINLKDEYDHIIIDCPAVGLVSDYLLLFHLADIHLFVTKYKSTKLSQLEELEKFKEKGDVKNLFLVLNGVPGKKLKHGYFSYDASIEQNDPTNRKMVDPALREIHKS